MKARCLDEAPRSWGDEIADWSAPEASPPSAKARTRLTNSYFALWVMAVIASGAAFVSYLALRFETVRLGYEVDDATREHRRLSEHKRLLALEMETLRERRRVHAIAQRALGMVEPSSSQVVLVETRASVGERAFEHAGAGQGALGGVGLGERVLEGGLDAAEPAGGARESAPARNGSDRARRAGRAR